MIQLLGDRYFQRYRRGSSAREAIFTSKVGHTRSRAAGPILFDRFYAALLAQKPSIPRGRTQTMPCRSLQYHSQKGFHVEGYDANRFSRRWGRFMRARCIWLSTIRF